MSAETVVEAAGRVAVERGWEGVVGVEAVELVGNAKMLEKFPLK